MPETTRRALLATLGAGAVGATAGCQSLTNDRPDLGPPQGRGLASATVFLGDGVSLPPGAAAGRVQHPADADLAVFPPGEASVRWAAETVAADVPVAVAGADAFPTLLSICRAADRPYGFTSNGWDSQTGVAGAVPSGRVLDTHVFVTAQPPRDLPWALGELLHPSRSDCAVPVEHLPVADTAASLGTARVLGYNAVGEFDRRDRVAVVPGGSPTPVFVDTHATVVAGRRGGEGSPYHVEQVETSVQFDHPLTDVGPAGQRTEGLAIRNVSDPTTNTAAVRFTPRNERTRERFTACQRARLVVEEFSSPFRYTGNARFRWTDPQLLAADSFVHHTPGSAVWYPR